MAEHGDEVYVDGASFTYDRRTGWWLINGSVDEREATPEEEALLTYIIDLRSQLEARYHG